MDPFLTPLLVGGGLGLVGGTATVLAGRKASKQRKERIGELDEQLAKDDFGLSETEKREAMKSMQGGLGAAAAQSQSQNEAAMAAGGIMSGGDLSRLAGQTTRTVAEGSRKAGESLLSTDLALAEQERMSARAEKNQLEAAQAQWNQDKVKAFLGPLAPAAGAAAQMAAGPPELRMGADQRAAFIDAAVKNGTLDAGSAQALAGLSPRQLRAFDEKLMSMLLEAE